MSLLSAAWDKHAAAWQEHEAVAEERASFAAVEVRLQQRLEERNSRCIVPGTYYGNN